jgi:hypothetical protein
VSQRSQKCYIKKYGKISQNQRENFQFPTGKFPNKSIDPSNTSVSNKDLVNYAMVQFNFFVTRSLSLVAIIVTLTSVLLLVHIYDRHATSRRTLRDISNDFTANNSKYDGKIFEYFGKVRNFSSQENLAELYYQNQLLERNLNQSNFFYGNLGANFPCINGVNPIGTDSLRSIQDGIYL